jgi:hypothetical protein
LKDSFGVEAGAGKGVGFAALCPAGHIMDGRGGWLITIALLFQVAMHGLLKE